QFLAVVGCVRPDPLEPRHEVCQPGKQHTLADRGVKFSGSAVAGDGKTMGLIQEMALPALHAVVRGIPANASRQGCAEAGPFGVEVVAQDSSYAERGHRATRPRG